MDEARSRALSRRAFQKLCLALPAPLAMAAASGSLPGWRGSALAQDDDDASPEATPGILPPTPACDDGDEPTLAQTEGPFYTPETPERTSLLEPGIVGTPMILTGYVLSTDCRPIPNALLDFWHADDAGVYDNDGFTLRGHQHADDEGVFYLETIVPGLYPGRTRHFHVKVQAPDNPVLTTQLYFPEVEDNERDGIFDAALLMDVEDDEGGEGVVGFFNFVLDVD